MKHLKYPALFMAAALFACPAWTLAQDAAPAATSEEAPSEDRAEGEAAGSDTAESVGPGSINQQDTNDADDTAAGAGGSGAASGGKGKASVRGEVQVGADADTATGAEAGADVDAGAAADTDEARPAGARDTYNRANARQSGAQGKAGAQGNAGARGQAGAAAAEGGVTAQGQMSMDDHFLMGAASGNMLEIQAAKLALTKSQRPEVKEFAQHIIKDHTKASQRLMQIAKSKQMQVPTEMKPSHRGELQELQTLDGEMFERAFIINNVGDHVKMVLKFRDASENLQDADLKAFAAEQLPALQSHLEHAQQLAGWDGATTAGAREGVDAGTTTTGGRRTPAAGERETTGTRTGAVTGSTRGAAGTSGAAAGGKEGTQGDAAEGEPSGSDTSDDRGPGSVNEQDTNDADDAAAK